MSDRKEFIQCKCGCGTPIPAKTKDGGPRQYVQGHNMRVVIRKLNARIEYNNKRRTKRAQMKKLFIEKAGGKCAHCGYEMTTNNICVFDFHHVDPKKKKFELNQNTFTGKKFELVVEEVEKCIVLCANCHRLEHSKSQTQTQT